MADIEFLESALEEEKRKHEALQEECAFLLALVMRKHYKNISEGHYASMVRRRNMYVTALF